MEVAFLLLALKVCHPRAVHLNRGNHEAGPCDCEGSTLLPSSYPCEIQDNLAFSVE